MYNSRMISMLFKVTTKQHQVPLLYNSGTGIENFECDYLGIMSISLKNPFWKMIGGRSGGGSTGETKGGGESGTCWIFSDRRHRCLSGPGFVRGEANESEWDQRGKVAAGSDPMRCSPWGKRERAWGKRKKGCFRPFIQGEMC